MASCDTGGDPTRLLPCTQVREAREAARQLRTKADTDQAAAARALAAREQKEAELRAQSRAAVEAAAAEVRAARREAEDEKSAARRAALALAGEKEATARAQVRSAAHAHPRVPRAHLHLRCPYTAPPIPSAPPSRPSHLLKPRSESLSSR